MRGGRFLDKWVVEQSLFDFFQLGSGACACCSFNTFNPDGLKGLINSMTDLETDGVEHELNAAEKSPWPKDMRDQVWSDRVVLRFKCKKDISVYADYWKEVEGDTDEDKIESIKAWCCDHVGPMGLLKLLQLPKSEIIEHIHHKYGIQKHSPYGIVFSTVVKQVTNFKVTKYPTEGRSLEEIEFESILNFDRRGGFTLPITSDGETISNEFLTIFIKRMKSLGYKKLLSRGPRTSKEEDDDGGYEEEEVTGEGDVEESKGASFRSDRRMVRLLIARLWTDQLMSRYKSYQEEIKENGCVGLG